VNVIVRTERGLEAGEILCDAAQSPQDGAPAAAEGQILRAMTPEDAHELSRIHDQEREEYRISLRSIAKLGLEMQLVDIEHLFGGERIIVYYLAEGRVDFRELVKLLASEFQTRIEMRQIGVRDEAKLLADFGDCGKPVCCNTHLIEMPPVSMKMAKLQKATLDPTKISGRCGRLKCCLRYEYEMYEKLQKELPPLGSRVQTPDGPARVVGHEVLANQLLVETDDRRRRLVDLADAVLLETQSPRGAANHETP
jgi:cell fate regulator YaaT (PSP1 superfamily)